MEMRLIDADAFRDENNIAKAEPTVEQPQIVRCKDCMNGDPYLKPDKYGRYGVCELHNHIIKSADWFCADGKPKDGEVNDSD